MKIHVASAKYTGSNFESSTSLFRQGDAVGIKSKWLEVFMKIAIGLFIVSD